MAMELINETQAASRLHLAVATLRKWRSTGVPNLRFYKLSRAVKYSVADLEEFIRRGARGGDE